MDSTNAKPRDPVVSRLDRYVAALDGPEPLGLGDLLTEDPECNQRISQLIATITHLDGLMPQESTAQPPGSCPALELDGWKLRRVLGRGGSGVVFEGERSDGERAAVKAILRTNDGRNKARWQREVDVVSQLKHRHIIPLIDAGESGDIPYVAMRLVDGASLAEIIHWQRTKASEAARADTEPALSAHEQAETTPHRPTLSSLSAGHRPYVQAALLAMADVADALDAAHQAGVIHRDVKPSNVLVEPNGHIWLSDFGMAVTEADRTLTASGMTVGALGYMSPEQAAGMSGDPRSDIYSLGVTALELLTLTPPLASLPWRSERLRSVRGAWHRGLPYRARRILLRMISVDPQQRPSSASDVARQLRMAAGESISSVSPVRLGAAALLLGVGVTLWFSSGWFGGRSDDRQIGLDGRIVPTTRIDQNTADAMRQERIELLRKTAPKHSWEQAVDRNDARLVIGLAAHNDRHEVVDRVLVGDHFWLVVSGDSAVLRDGNWQRAVTFSIRGIVVADPPRRFRVNGDPVWADGYQPLDEQFKFFEPTCMAGPISVVAVDKRLYSRELGDVPPQNPLARLECVATASGDVNIRFELPTAAVGNSNTIRHVPRELFDEEVTVMPLTLKILKKNDDSALRNDRNGPLVR